MIPAAFAYQRATTVDEALSLLMAHGADAKVIAGGQSLIPLMKLRLARPDRLIDIGRLDELKGVRQRDGGLSIGPLTTYAQLLADPVVTRYALMADALPRIGDVQVRNRGTIGGSIAHADPASDMPAVLLALDAELVLRSAHEGERTVPISTFFEGPFTTAIGDEELLTEIRVMPSSNVYGSAYRALEQPASGYAIVGVAAVVGGSGDGNLSDVRIAVTGVGDHAYRAGTAEAALKGTKGDADAVKAAAAKVTDGIDVQGDIHADSAYRTAVAAVMAQRAIDAAVSRLNA
jgi:carbon-monoxide dehydrogenase medium subunit